MTDILDRLRAEMGEGYSVSLHPKGENVAVIRHNPPMVDDMGRTLTVGFVVDEAMLSTYAQNAKALLADEAAGRA